MLQAGSFNPVLNNLSELGHFPVWKGWTYNNSLKKLGAVATTHTILHNFFETKGDSGPSWTSLKWWVNKSINCYHPGSKLPTHLPVSWFGTQKIPTKRYEKNTSSSQLPSGMRYVSSQVLGFTTGSPLQQKQVFSNQNSGWIVGCTPIPTYPVMGNPVI